MAEQQTVKVTPKELEASQKTWDSFVEMSKYGIYATAALLILLALMFVKF